MPSKVLFTLLILCATSKAPAQEVQKETYEHRTTIAQLIEIRQAFGSVFSMKALARRHSSNSPVKLDSVRLEPVYVGRSLSVREANASVEFINLSSSTISSIEWKVDIYDQNRRSPVDSFYLKSNKSVAPSKKGHIHQDMGNLKLPYSPAALFQIIRITYTDGSVWQPTEDCTANNDISSIVCQNNQGAELPKSQAIEPGSLTTQEGTSLSTIRKYLNEMGAVIDENRSKPELLASRYADSSGQSNNLVIVRGNDNRLGFFIYNFGNIKKARNRQEVQQYVNSLNNTITVGNFFIDKDGDIGYSHIVNGDQKLGKAAFESIYTTMTKVALKERPEIQRFLDMK